MGHHSRTQLLSVGGGDRRQHRTTTLPTQPIDCTIRTIVLLLQLIVLLADMAQSVKIVHHSISHTIDGGNTTASTVLDCDYIYDPGDVKLVVRWFYNDSPEPIYQWIPSSDTRYVGELIRGHFDMDYKVGDDRFTKYRAIRLVPSNHQPHHEHHHNSSAHHLPVSLSGKYTCLISSIMSQDSRHGQLVVYVPPDKFEFSLQASDVITNPNGPLLRCSVERVYPKPVLTFSELLTGNAGPVPPPASMSAHFHSFPSVEVNTVQNDSTGLYSTWFEYRLAVDSIKVGTVYECKLELPSTNFVRKKRIKLIYPSTYLYPAGSNGVHQNQNYYHEQDRLNWSKPPRISRLPPGGKSDSSHQAQLHKTNVANRSNTRAWITLWPWLVLLTSLVVLFHW